MSWIVFGVGCARQPEVSPASMEGVVVGKTTLVELKTRFGVPIHSYIPSHRVGAEVQVYSRANSFQVEEGKVVAHFRAPSAQVSDRDEKSLQFWRHQWRGKNPSFEEIPGSQDVHGRSLFLLRESENHSAVVYDPAQGEVIRVVQYGE